MSSVNYNPSNNFYQPSNLPYTTSGIAVGPVPTPPSCPENGHLHPDGYEANEGQATNPDRFSDKYGCTVEPEELEHTCLYHSILDKLDRDESLALEEVDRLSNLRESLSDPTVLKVLELLEYIDG